MQNQSTEQSSLQLAKKVFGKSRTQKLVQETTSLFKKLFPICRSITGNGVRESLKIIRNISTFDIFEIPSGTNCYDWTVPDEWNISEAFIKDKQGTTIVDFQKNNLHVVSYSSPLDKWLSFLELDKHLHYLPDYPDAIPYRTSYYEKNWGFCLSYNQYLRLNRNGKYHVYIKSSLRKGNLTYGTKILKGHSSQELLLSTYCCHPSMANDNLSGIVLWILLLREMANRKNRFTYRFIIAPETIGAICYLAQHQKSLKHVKGGFVITTVAGHGPFGYKKTYLGNDLIDRAVLQTFAEENLTLKVYPFDINGSDESRYSSPGIRIPMGTICKDKYYEYDAYHTSQDNLKFIKAECLVETLAVYFLTLMKLERNYTYVTQVKGEPMYNKRNLYPALGGFRNLDNINFLNCLRWLHFYGDGTMSLLDISEKTHIPMSQLHETAKLLQKHKLLKRTKDKNTTL